MLSSYTLLFLVSPLMPGVFERLGVPVAIGSYWRWWERPLLARAVRRMRANEVAIEAGYDGEYGRIKLFSDAEKQALLCQRRLFPGMAATAAAGKASDPPSARCPGADASAVTVPCGPTWFPAPPGSSFRPTPRRLPRP